MQEQHSSMEAAEKIKIALEELDREMVNIDGRQLKPSQCYRLELQPVHVLFNTNCPDTLKEKVQDILTKHFPQDTTE